VRFSAALGIMNASTLSALAGTEIADKVG